MNQIYSELPLRKKDNRIMKENVNFQEYNFILPYNNKFHKAKFIEV
jgi:hypothetical protein